MAKQSKLTGIVEVLSLFVAIVTFMINLQVRDKRKDTLIQIHNAETKFAIMRAIREVDAKTIGYEPPAEAVSSGDPERAAYAYDLRNAKAQLLSIDEFLEEIPWNDQVRANTDALHALEHQNEVVRTEFDEYEPPKTSDLRFAAIQNLHALSSIHNDVIESLDNAQRFAGKVVVDAKKDYVDTEWSYGVWNFVTAMLFVLSLNLASWTKSSNSGASE